MERVEDKSVLAPKVSSSLLERALKTSTRFALSKAGRILYPARIFTEYIHSSLEPTKNSSDVLVLVAEFSCGDFSTIDADGYHEQESERLPPKISIPSLERDLKLWTKTTPSQDE